MKAINLAFILGCAVGVGSHGADDSVLKGTVTRRGPHDQVVEFRTGRLLEDDTEEVIRYTEVANGLNYWNGEAWVESVPAFELVDGRALAHRTQQKLTLAADIHSPEAVMIELPDGQILRSNPVGLSMYQPSTDRNLLIAEVVPTVGQLVAPNIVLFDNCFDTIHGAIRYSVSRSGVAQEVIIYSRNNVLDPETRLSDSILDRVLRPAQAEHDRTQGEGPF